MPEQEEIKDMNFGVHVLPKEDNKYELGSSEKQWKTIYGTVDGKMSHKLTIGNQVYDGSGDVTIPVYDGSYT